MSDEKKGKGSWEEAFQLYVKRFHDTYNTGSFYAGMESPIPDQFDKNESQSITNARISFKNAMRLLLKEKDPTGKNESALVGKILHHTSGEKSGLFCFEPRNSDEVRAGNNLLAEFLYRIAHVDETYFKELLKFTKGLTKRLPISASLYVFAERLKNENGIDPKREEVIDLIRKEQPELLWNNDIDSKHFREAGLGFLEGGKPGPKNSRKRRKRNSEN